MGRDRIYLTEKGKVYDEPGKGRTEYVMVEPLRTGLTPKLWQTAIQLAMRTPGISAPAVQRARDLVEGAGNGHD